MIQGSPAVGETVKVTVTVSDSESLVAVTVIVPVPAGAVGAVVIISIEVAEPPAGTDTVDGLSDPVIPDATGTDTERSTSPAKSFRE